jgi:hypothetical protein
MIATVTIAQDQLEETISTCRFAQRVAMVSNEVMRIGKPIEEFAMSCCDKMVSSSWKFLIWFWDDR